jgi:hypothetical protein
MIARILLFSLRNPEWWLVILGFPTLGVVIWQAWKTHEAAESARKSSEAAASQVAHMIASERPFLMIELRGSETIKDEVWAVNCGKSPAQLTWYNSSGSILMKTHEEIDELPPQFDYGYLYDAATAQIFNVPWIAAGGEMQLCRFDWIALGEELTYAYQNGQKTALFLSAIKYRGMSGDAIYESKWCFRWLGRDYGLKLAGPYGYNSYS